MVTGENPQTAPDIHPHVTRPPGRYLLFLCLSALGVVYGDIGTSPLYAFRECFSSTAHPIPPTEANVLGVLSLIFWALVIVICIKYLVFVMRADNRGEGGIISLMSLIAPEGEARKRRGTGVLVAMGLFGAALLYGDGMITPAVTVLSAIEGLKVATPVFEKYVIYITIIILLCLFIIQRRGTAGVGVVFGPITLLWFFTIAILGARQIASQPGVMAAVLPTYAVQFFLHNGMTGFFVLGSVFLVVTGGEALYADMGHFGKYPIRLSWFVVVLPALLLNYFGQGALLLRDPRTVENPFYLMVPAWALYPMVALATAAASVASQAIISGAFSLTRQAVLLGYSPRVKIHHTSAKEIGQIYIPAVNWALCFFTIMLVLGFQSSSKLAAAYGVAVTTDMVFTTILLFFVARDLWKWRRSAAVALMGAFLTVDVAFFSANIIKVPQGGWFPLVIAAMIYTMMTTWRRGRQILNDRLQVSALPDQLFIKSVEITPPLRVRGTAVFMDRTRDATPHALLHNIKHNKVLHDRTVLLTVETRDVPHVNDDERLELTELGHGLYRIIIYYGFTEDPNVPVALQKIKVPGLEFRPMETSYFLGRESLIASPKWGMAVWREKLFAWMSQNATNAAFFFRIPPNRVVELGAQVEL